MKSIDDRAQEMFSNASAQESSLPYQAAHQQQQIEWLASRPDPFAQVLSSMQLSYRQDHGGRMTVDRSFVKEYTPEEHQTAAAESIPIVQSDLKAELDSLKDDLLPFDPLTALHALTMLNCIGRWGEYHEPSHEGLEAIPEIAASAVASESRPYGSSSPEIANVRSLNQRCREVLQLSSYLSQLRSVGGTRFERTAAFSAGHWMTIRGNSYLHHGHQVASEILAPRAKWMLDTFGFTFEQYMEVASGIHALELARLNGLELGPGQRAGLSCEAVANFASLDVEVVASVVERLTITVGSIEAEFTGPYGGSVLDTRPIIGDADRFVVPVPGRLLRDVLSIFEPELVAKYPKFVKHRASTVDGLALASITDVLEESDSGLELTYLHDDGDGLREFEVDAIIKFERFVLVVEGKAGKLSKQALRGDAVRASRDLRKGLVHAQVQANRVARQIAAAQETAFRDADGNEIIVSRSEVDAIITLHPTLHSPGVYAFETDAVAEELKLEKATPAILPLLLTDLFVICELTGNPATLLHYLGWRQSITTGDSLLVLDELDLLGTYLFGGASELSKALASGQPVMNLGSTVDIDAYYNGVTGQGPRMPRLSKYMGEYFLDGELTRITKDRKRNWLESAFTILELEISECGQLEGAVDLVSPAQIAPERFRAHEFDDVVAIYMGEEASFIEDALAMANCGPGSHRRIHLRVDESGCRIVKATRHKRLVDFRSIDDWPGDDTQDL